MKNLPIILSSLALIGVLVLFGMNMSGSKGSTKKADTSASKDMTTKGRIAYVNIDTLEAKYEYLIEETKAFETRKNSMSNELERSQKKFQQDYMAAQRKAEAGTLTQAEYESTAKRLQQMQQSLERREVALTEKLLKEQEEFNKNLKERLDKFLGEYNEDKEFDYILSYSSALGVIMLGNEALNITDDVVSGMNKAYKAEGKKSDKDTKKKNK